MIEPHKTRRHTPAKVHGHQKVVRRLRAFPFARSWHIMNQINVSVRYETAIKVYTIMCMPPTSATMKQSQAVARLLKR